MRERDTHCNAPQKGFDVYTRKLEDILILFAQFLIFFGSKAYLRCSTSEIVLL